MGTEALAPTRLASLDQFRGYTVAGMFLVNFIGSYAAVHVVFSHQDTFCSYADTIMPCFFFAVGFAYRLTLLRRLETERWSKAYLRVLRRNLGLILLGIMLYKLEGGVGFWARLQELGLSGVLEQAFKNARVIQTLVHIGITSIWVMPVIAARPLARILFMIFSGGLHVWLSAWFYYDEWPAKGRGIDGGPLGFLTWTIPLLAGSLAYDAMTGGRRWSAILKFLLSGVLLMVIAYLISCLDFATPPPTWFGNIGGPSWVNDKGEVTGLSAHWAEPPFIDPDPGRPRGGRRAEDMWRMNQRAGSITYLTFGAGLALVVYAFFVLIADILGWATARERSQRLSALDIVMLGLAWIFLTIGSVAMIFSLIKLIRPDWDLQGTFGQSTLSEYISAFKSTEWTLAALYGWVVALLGWDLRQVVRRETPCTASVLRTLGSNALAGYIIHDWIVEPTIRPFVPRDAPLWYVLAAFAVFFGICYLFIRHLEKNKLYLRL